MAAEGLRVGLVGTGAIADLHARAYQNIGFTLGACTDVDADSGRRFIEKYGGDFFPSLEDRCADPEIDYIDVCTLPNFRLEPVRLAAKHRKHVQVQKPIATNLDTARAMIDAARAAGITLGVVSQHRFDESSRFLIDALRAGRLGRLLQCDASVKWYLSLE
jgi:predicted dehydrogenase